MVTKMTVLHLEDEDEEDMVAAQGNEDTDSCSDDDEVAREEKRDEQKLVAEAIQRIQGLPVRTKSYSRKLTKRDLHDLDEFRSFYANRTTSKAAMDYTKKKPGYQTKYAAKKIREESGKTLNFSRCDGTIQEGLKKSRAAEWEKWQTFHANVPCCDPCSGR